MANYVGAVWMGLQPGLGFKPVVSALYVTFCLCLCVCVCVFVGQGMDRVHIPQGALT